MLPASTSDPFFVYADNFNGLGLFFDTYPNSRHTYSFPRVTAMMGDGQKSYDHDHDNQEHELAACSVSMAFLISRTCLPNFIERISFADGLPQAGRPDIIQAAIY